MRKALQLFEESRDFRAFTRPQKPVSITARDGLVSQLSHCSSGLEAREIAAGFDSWTVVSR
jgi:hypothetical protein